jgi:hypothetical protein
MNPQSYSRRILTCFFSLALLASNHAAAEDQNNKQKNDVDAERIKQESLVNVQYLLANVLQKSKILQEAYGDFSPYGAALFRSGQVKYVWYAKPGEMVKNPADSIPVIRRALQTQALSEKIVGSAVIYKLNDDSTKKPKLTVEMEYQTGLAVAFATEMMFDADDKVVWGSNAQTNFSPRVFVSDGTSNEPTKEALAAQPEVKKDS